MTPDCDLPQTIFGELTEQFADAITQHPRSLQAAIGPSQVGDPCPRRLLHQLAGQDEPDRRPPPWKATVGTAIHSWIEQTLSASIVNVHDGQPRYLLERRVTVGRIAGIDVQGSCDCFDIPPGCVIDWKTKGKSTMSGHRRNGPGDMYRAQAHLYGRGMANAGFTVNTVMIVFLPRDGEFNEIFYWSEPYDEQIAVAALDRATGLAELSALLGVDRAADLYPLCGDEFCAWCSKIRPGMNRALRKLSTTTV